MDFSKVLKLKIKTYHLQKATPLELNLMSDLQKNILNQFLNVLNNGIDNSNLDYC